MTIKIGNNMRAQDFIPEVNAAGELSVDPDLIKRFTDQGWQIDGEGRDQIVLSKPNSNTVLKIVGFGSLPRQAEIRRYVTFFRANQRNPHFPRVGPDRELTWKGRKYYAYTQERLLSLPGDEAVLDYLEKFIGNLDQNTAIDERDVPDGLTYEQVDGLVQAIDRMFSAGFMGGYDLANSSNIMQRDNGQLVIVDPFSSHDDELSEAQNTGKTIRAYHGNQGGIDTERLHAPMWFSSSREDAEQYAGDDGYVVVVDLDIKNPYMLRPGEEANTVLRRWQDLQTQGHDGIYDRRLGDWIPFSKEQIRVVSKDDVMKENFADGKVKGKSRPGRVKRAGASCKGSVTDLRARAKKYGGERGKMYHWCANMKSGRKNK